jgi:hypothetical protein
MRRAHPPRRVVLRRLLVLGGLLICGWLISSLQSAHAADVTPPPGSSAGTALDAVQAATSHSTTATHARDDSADPAGSAHGRSALRHADAVTHPASAHPAGTVSTRSATQPAHTTSSASSAEAVHGPLTDAQQTVHRAPAATGTISPGTHASTSAPSVGSAAPRGASLRGLTELPAAAHAPTRVHHAAPASASAAHPPAAPGLSAAIDSLALNPAAAGPSSPLPAPGPLPALNVTAPPHPPPLLGLSPPLNGPLRRDAIAALDPAVLDPAVLDPAVLDPAVLDPAVLDPAVLDPAVLDPLPGFGDPAGLLRPVTDVIGGLGTGPAAGLTGPLRDATVLDPLSVLGDPAGLLRPVTDVIGSVAGLVADPSAVLTGPLGNLLTTALATNPLGVLTAPLKGVLGQVGGLTAQLIPQFGGLLGPVAGLVAPIEGIGGPAGLADETPIGSLLPSEGSAAAWPAGDPSSTVGSWPMAGMPAGSGHVGMGGSVEQQIAQAPVTPTELPLGTGPRASSSRVLRGQWPQPPPRLPAVPRDHMSGQSTGPFSPGDPNVPLSGTSNRALPSSSQNDGSGDTPHSWQARVLEAFVPARIVAPSAVRTAADEPAFSPD